MTTVNEIYKELKEKLQSKEAEKESKIIIETLLGISATELITKGDEILTKNQLKKIKAIEEERSKTKVPLAYLLEEAHFMDMKLFVNKDVLIPRPETELLVEKTLEEIKKRKISHPVILDLGTGSGCIAIALKRALPAAKVYATDISKGALNVAGINAKSHKVDIEFVLGDYLDPFMTDAYRSLISLPVMNGDPPYFDVIISNPPYVSKEDYEKLEPELFHEPIHALVGFPYAHIKNQIYQKPGLLKEKGFLACEFGQGQMEEISKIFPNANIYKDYAGIPRYFISSKEIA